MSRFNYNSLLEYLQLSNLQFIVIFIVSFLIFSIIYFLYKIGLLTRIKFKAYLLPQTHFLYISYQGNYDKIQQSFQQVMQDTSSIFKLSQPFGIYYDNPKQIQNPDQSRAVLGCIVNKAQRDKVKLFLQKFPQYKRKEINYKTTCLGTQYPFFNALSMIMVIVRVYPRLAEQVKKRKIQKKVGILQVYKLSNQSDQCIQVLLPLQNLADFELWYPPVQKNSQNKQKQN